MILSTMITIFYTVVLSMIQGVALNTGVLPFSKNRTLQQMVAAGAAKGSSRSRRGKVGGGGGSERTGTGSTDGQRRASDNGEAWPKAAADQKGRRRQAGGGGSCHRRGKADARAGEISVYQLLSRG
jgi:hypothetical protein